jgi:hypothetical protein
MSDKHVFSRHTDVDSQVIKLAVVMVTMRCLDDNSAPHNAIMKALELGSFLANASLDRRRRLHSMEADLQGYLHLTLRSVEPSTT